jgi:hypothetical protein
MNYSTESSANYPQRNIVSVVDFRIIYQADEDWYEQGSGMEMVSWGLVRGCRIVRELGALE